MNSRHNKNAFTILELLVAIALLAGILAASGVIFSHAVKAYRASAATSDITKKLRAVTDRITADVSGIRKDGYIFIAWMARPVDSDGDGNFDDEDGNGFPDKYVRFDRMLFFADGNFTSYRQWKTQQDDSFKVITGNLARIFYMPAINSEGVRARYIPDNEQHLRVLGRTQHILTAEIFYDVFDMGPEDFPNLVDFPDPFNDTDIEDWKQRNDLYEHDQLRVNWGGVDLGSNMDDWLNMNDDWLNMNTEISRNILFAITDIRLIFDTDPVPAPAPLIDDGGIVADIDDPDTYHRLFAEGVSSFKIQGWLESENRWYPQVDRNGDGNPDDGDFRAYYDEGTDPDQIDSGDPMPAGAFAEPGNPIPFTALKFTFTLHDSRGVFPEGRTFSHIVYLD